jgi:hypothetical protein
MADILRPLKTFGSRTYADEVAAAPGNRAPILSAEVDADLDLLYNTWNAGVGVGDIKPGSVGPNELANDAVTSAKIKDGEVKLNDLAADSVDSSKIVNGSITSDDLGANSVTVFKIAPGSTVRTRSQVDIAAQDRPVDKNSQIWAQSGQITPAGNKLNAWLTAALKINSYPTGGGAVLLFRLSVFQNLIDTVVYGLVVEPSVPTTPSVGPQLITIPMMTSIDVTPGVAATVRFSAQQSQPGGALYWASFGGRLLVEESS